MRVELQKQLNTIPRNISIKKDFWFKKIPNLLLLTL